jgi:hypothetical protein
MGGGSIVALACSRMRAGGRDTGADACDAERGDRQGCDSALGEGHASLLHPM